MNQRGHVILLLLVLLVDAASVAASIELSLLARTALGFTNDGDTLIALVRWSRIALIVGWVATLAVVGAHRHTVFGHGTTEYRYVIRGSLVAGLLVGVGMYLTRSPLSRVFYFLLILFAIVLLLLGRFVIRRTLHLIRRRGGLQTRVLLVGSTEQQHELRRVFLENRWLGFLVVATSPPISETDITPVLEGDGKRSGLLQLAETERVDLILFASGAVNSSVDFRRYIWEFEGHHTQLAVMPSLVDIAADRVRSRPVAGLPIIYIEDPRSYAALSSGKRAFDIILATLVLAFFGPLMLITAALVKQDGGPALFRQLRIGRDGNQFQMLKFRSMVPNAEELRRQLLPQGTNETNPVMFKLADDPRVTPVGRIIRRYSVDELPQLLNVLRGEMSLIGPRPPLPEEVAQYTFDEMRRLRVRPGMTGLWQVSGRSDLSWEQTVRLDLYYIDNWSVVQDAAILVKTVRAVFSRSGAY